MIEDVSISSSYYYSTPIDEQIRLVADSGFTAFSLGANLNHFDYRDSSSRRELKCLADDLGLAVDTVHGKSLDSDASYEGLSVAIEAAEELDAHSVVVHPVPFALSGDEATIRKRIAASIDRCRDLFAATSVRIAVENVMPGVATDLVAFVLSEVNSKNVGFCYDSSHEQVDGPREYSLVRQFADRLYAVHISDRSREFVDHQIPGEGFIDFGRVCQDLFHTSFAAPLLLEVMMKHSVYRDEKQFLREANRAASELKQRINGHGRK